jgi:tetratricopeptide (TPR) repeat protein
MPENTPDTGAEAFLKDVNFGDMTEEEYGTFLENEPQIRELLEIEQKGIFDGTAALADVLGFTDADLLGVATAGADLMEEERWEEARDVFIGLTTLQPGAPLFHVCLAQAYDGLESVEMAVESYTQAIDLIDVNTEDEKEDRKQIPVLTDALYGRGCLNVNLGNTEQALADLRRLCEIVPESSDPRAESALQLMGAILGGEEGEMAALDSDLATEDPDESVLTEHPEMGDSLAEDLVAVAKGEMPAAALSGMTDAELARTADTGFTLLENGRYLDAEKVFSGLVSLDPSIATFHLALGDTYAQLGEEASAQESYDAAVKLVDEWDGEGTHENAFDAYYRRGRLHLQNGDGEQALADLTKAIEIQPDAENELTQHAAVLVSAMVSAAEDEAKG